MGVRSTVVTMQARQRRAPEAVASAGGVSPAGEDAKAERRRPRLA
jgi:hypothetical protein